MDDSKSKEVVTKIIAWLNSSKVVGEATNEFVSFGSNPTELRLKLRNNTFILIEDAVDGVSTKLDNGIQVQSIPVRDQVTLVQSGKKAIRINSPELKTWIQKGWSEEDVLKFTEKDAIAKVLKMKTEFPASPDQVKTMFEDVGGVQGSKVEVKLTTMVEELGMMEYVIALTKNYQLKVGGNDVVTYWKYHVNPSRATLIDSKNEMPAIK
jgi:hypothetical protein